MAADDYRQMLIDSNADDIHLTAEVTGIPANMLRKSLERSGFKPAAKHDGFNLLKEIETLKAWRDIWSGGQGIGLLLVRDILRAHGFAFRLETGANGRTAFTCTLAEVFARISFKSCPVAPL